MSEMESSGCIDPQRSLGHDDQRFPGRRDYERRYITSLGKDIWKQNDLVVSIQNHWQSLGQTGCAFAQRLARNNGSSGWRASVHYPNEVGWRACRDQVDEQIERAVRSPDCELLSLMFPLITSGVDLVRILNLVGELKRASIETSRPVAGHAAVSVRVELAPGVESWVLGFGPLTFLPLTRQAPTVEFVIRTKTQKQNRMNMRRANKCAHVADVPIDVDSRQFDRLWSVSVRRTQTMRSLRFRTLARARVTFSLPTRLAALLKGVR